jgi:hypothetical protein
MKKLITFLSAIAISHTLYSQPDTTNLQRSQIKKTVTQAINDLNESDVTARPIKVRPNSSSCNTHYSKVGIADLEKRLIKQKNKKGKWENIKQDFYKIHTIVNYDCNDYTVKVRKEPHIFKQNSLINKNEKQNPYTLIIKKQNNKYKINSNLKLRPITEQNLKRIYEESIEMSKKYFE